MGPDEQPTPRTVAVRGVVRGRVQGVGFRYYAHREALRHGVVGWIANRADGSVEFVAQGTPRALSAFRAFLERGPSHANVAGLTWESHEVDAGLTGFAAR